MAKHEKVSVEQVREKRLAAQQSAHDQSQPQTQTETSQLLQNGDEPTGGIPGSGMLYDSLSGLQGYSGGTDAQLSGGSLSGAGGSANNYPPVAYPDTLPATPPITTPPVIPDLESMIANLSPDQLAKLRVIAASKGVKLPSQSIIGTGTKNVDGSLDVIVHLEPEVVEQLENWSEPGGDTLVEAAQKYITQSLVAFLYGDWSPTPEPVAEPVASVTK